MSLSADKFDAKARQPVHVHVMRRSTSDDNECGSIRYLELKVIDKLIDVFKDDKDGLLEALKLTKLRRVDPADTKPRFMHSYRDRA